MKTLIIAEKPSAAIDIRKGLEKYGSFKKLDWGFESQKYIVTWLVGHVLQLKQPKDYPSWEGKWSLSVLPWFPPGNQFEYKENPKTRDVFKKVSTFIKRKDVGLIINACDAEREGDLIFWEVYDYNKVNTPVKRFWESASLTPKVVQNVIENDLKDESFWRPRKDASYARAFADLLLGMNFTVGFTAKARTTLHMGRVQTPTIAILAKKRKEIDAFKTEKYFEVEAEFENKEGIYKGTWFKNKLGNTRFDKKEEADRVVNKINGKQGKVVKKDVIEEKVKHDLLYSLTTLQQDANKKFGYKASKTLKLAQSLYETHKILSYPRSESEVLGEDHVPQLKPTLQAINSGSYQPFANHILTQGIKTTKRFVNNDKLTDHHAIIPTTVKPNISKLSKDEQNIYDLVVKRFLSCFYPEAKYEKTEIVTEVEQETFKTSGKIEIDAGWKVVYGKDDSNAKEAKLPIIAQDEINKVKRSESNNKETKPPKHYTEGTLLGVMKNPKKLLTDKELKDAITGAGLGTPATRDAVIENIVKRGYIARKGKQLIATDLGMKLIEVSPDELKSPEITADWEQKLKDISNGKLDQATFMEEINQYIKKNINDLSNRQLSVDFNQVKNNDRAVGKCPKCKDGIVLEYKKAYACSNSTKESPCFVVFPTIAKKKLTTNQVKQLVEKEKTSLIKGFTGKKGKFDAYLVLDKDKKVTFSFGDQTKKREETSFKCPSCQEGDIVETEKGYFCNKSTRDKRCFMMAKKIASKAINQKQFKQLIENKETDEIEGFKGKKGPFSAKLKINGNKVDFEFVNKPKKTKEIGFNCPFCSGKVVENKIGFGCSQWKEKSCKFFVKKEISGKKISEKIVKELLQNKKTSKLEGFKSRKGSNYSASLKLNTEEKKVELSFD